MKQRSPQLRPKHPDPIRFRSASSDSGQPLMVQNYRNYLVHLLQTRPLVFWGGVWMTVFLVSILALGGLLSPSFSSRRPPAQIAVDAQAAVASDPEPNRDGQIPFWMFGAIALICGGTSFLVARYLQFSMSAPLRKAKRPVKFSKKSSNLPQQIVPPRTSYPKPSRELQPFSPTASLPFEVLPTFAQPIPQPEVQPVNPKRIHEQSARNNLIAWLIQDVDYTQPSLVNPLGSLTAMTAQSSDPQPVVTVVPADQTHALDWANRRPGNGTDRHRLRSLQAWLAEMS